MLPQDFTKRMEIMLGEEYEAFRISYEHERYQALRINVLKGDTGRFRQHFSHICLEAGQKEEGPVPVPWCSTGLYYPSEIRMGKHPYHEAGVYYIQEPSAMAPAEYLEAEPAGTGPVRSTRREKHADRCIHAGSGSPGL